MAISDTLNSIKTNLENAYTSLENKQATIPANKNIANLASAIDSIQQGGGEQGEFVYIKQVANDDGYTMYMDSTPNGGEKYKITYTETDDGLIDIALEGDESKLDLLYANTEIIVNGQTMELNEYDKSYGVERLKYSEYSSFTPSFIDTSGVINTINGHLMACSDIYLPNLLSTDFGFYILFFNGSSINLPKCQNVDLHQFNLLVSDRNIVFNFPECISFYYLPQYGTSRANITINIPKCESATIGDNNTNTVSTLNMNSNIKWLSLYQALSWSFTADNVLSFSQLEHFQCDNGALYSGVSLPNVKTISPGTFGGYNSTHTWLNLLTVSLPNLFSISGQSNTSAPNLFGYCSTLKEAYFPKFDMIYSNIGRDYKAITFYNLSSLEKVTLGSGTTYLSSSTFYNCSNLSFIDFQGATISYVNQDTFRNCYNLESINAKFNYSVGSNGFTNCYKLKELCFISFNMFASSAFANCSSLSVLQLKTALPQYAFSSSNIFMNCSNLSIIIIKLSTLTTDVLSGNLDNVFGTTPIGNSALLGYYGSIYVENEYLDFVKYKFGSYSNRVTSLDNLPEGVTVRV